MIHLHYWATPNGHKITIFLEEANLPYNLIPVDISKGDQHKPDYVRISPNHKMPAIVDDAPEDNMGPLPLFESGAILWYLAEKSRTLIPHSARLKAEVSAWLNWQVASLGPMTGQYHHFNDYAPAKIPYAIQRYENERLRLHKVLNEQLDGREWVAADMYTIADIAIYPWIAAENLSDAYLNKLPHLKKWLRKLESRPAIVKAYELAAPFTQNGPMTEEARKHLFAMENTAQ